MEPPTRWSKYASTGRCVLRTILHRRPGQHQKHNSKDTLHSAQSDASGTDFTSVLDEDVLHDVYGRLDVQDLQALRLVNRQSNAVASCYLFHTIVVRPRRSTLAKITSISENELFAKGVREVVWETGHYLDTLDLKGLVSNRGELHDLSEDWVGVRPGTLMDNTAQRLLEEEADARPELLDKLAAAFGKFNGLRKAAIYSWARSYEGLNRAWVRHKSQEQRPSRFVARLALTAKDHGPRDPIDRKYGPLPIFLNRGYEHRRQADALLQLLSALSAARRSLTQLLVQPTDEDVDRELFRRARCGLMNKLGLYMNVALESNPHLQIMRAAQPMKTLKKLRLRLRGDGIVSPDSLGALRSTGLPNLLRVALMLEELELSLDGQMTFTSQAPAELPRTHFVRRLIHIPIRSFVPSDYTFPRLRKLSLQSFAISASELCDLLARHGPTLELLTLSFVVLNCPEPEMEDYHSGDHGYLFCPRSPEYDTPPAGDYVHHVDPADAGTGRRALQMVEWYKVVEACRRLQSLKGLRIEAPMTYWRTNAHLCEADELEEMAMDGRSNSWRN